MKILDYLKSWFVFGTTSSLNRTCQTSSSQIVVNPRTSMQVSAFASCIDIIASDIGGLPFVVMRDDKPDKSHPLYPLLHTAANPYMTAQNYREVQQFDILVYGNAFAFVDKSPNQRVRAVYPIPAYLVTPQRVNGQLLYYVQGVDDPVPADLMLHIPGLAWDGIRGKSIIENHANSLGVALALDQFAAKFFANGTLTTGVLTYPGKLSAETRQNLRSAWHDYNAGLSHAHETPILSEGLDYKQLSIPPEQAQFLESRRYSAIEISRLPGLHVPPAYLNELDRATWNNIEHMGMWYVRHSLRRWILKWEHECNRKLLLEDEKATCSFRMLVDDLQRGDRQSRAAYYAQAIQWGWMTPADAAEAEGLDSDGLSDEPLSPLNMAPAGQPQQPAPTPPAPDQNAASVPSRKIKNALTREQKREKYRELIADAALRCCTKERNAVARIAKNNLPQDIPTFSDNVADFWEDHADTVRKTFRPVVNTYSQKRCERILHKVVQSMKDESMDAYAEAVTSPSPLESVTGLLGGWGENRHVKTAENFCKGEYE